MNLSLKVALFPSLRSHLSHSAGVQCFVYLFIDLFSTGEETQGCMRVKHLYVIEQHPEPPNVTI